MSMDMYQENILDHHQNPRNKVRLEGPTFVAKENNPLCGDDIEAFVQLGDDGKVAKVTFQGQGCAISQASMSMLTIELVGKSLDEVQKLGEQDIRDLVVVPLSPVRLKCATLGIKTVQKGLAAHKLQGLVRQA